MTMPQSKATNLQDLRASGWVSKSVKQELRDNFLRMLAAGDELFPGIVGYENTVVPEINIALIAGHDMLFLGEKGQGKSRLMRTLVRFLDDEIPFIAHPEAPLHDDPYRPITRVCRELVASVPARERERPGSRNSDRLVAALRALRRATRSRHKVCRHHRRDRPGQTGRRRQHVGRSGVALRTDSPHAPRPLRDERTAGT